MVSSWLSRCGMMSFAVALLAVESQSLRVLTEMDWKSQVGFGRFCREPASWCQLSQCCMISPSTEKGATLFTSSSFCSDLALASVE